MLLYTLGARGRFLAFLTHVYFLLAPLQTRRFVLINHSGMPDLENYHGRAINLHAGDERLPFHGAFLFHEMRVRGHWPLCEDRVLPLTTPWANWINPPGGNNRGRGHGCSRGRGGGGRGNGRGRNDSNVSGPSGDTSGGRYNLRSHDLSGKVFIPTNPFANPAALQALKDSFAKQPNWKAAVMEGTTWEGNADENAAKWRKLNGFCTISG